MSQQYQQQPTGHQTAQGFQQSVPMEVYQAVLGIEEFETEAEWAKTKALQSGDVYTAQELDDIVELVNFQKKLLIRQSRHAQTVSRCTQEVIQMSSQDLQQSGVPEVQQVAQRSQELAQTIQQASSQVLQQSGKPSPQMGGQSQMGMQR